jgi:AcrR family transcriptional regulator
MGKTKPASPLVARGRSSVGGGPRESATASRPDERGTRQRILGAAAQLFHEQGYHATTMRQIAAEAGIKAGSLYNHFAGKQELLYEISFDTMRDMLASAITAITGESDPGRRLRAFVHSHTLYCIEERFRARVADDELRDLEPQHLARVITIRDEYELVLRGILSDLDRQTHGVPDVTVTANAIATMASEVMTWFREPGRLTAGEVADMYAELALRMAGGDTSEQDEQARGS